MHIYNTYNFMHKILPIKLLISIKVLVEIPFLLVFCALSLITKVWVPGMGTVLNIY